MILGIIGSGGREHAICETLSKSKKVNKIYCFPGNAGTSNLAAFVAVSEGGMSIKKKRYLIFISESINVSSHYINNCINII